MKVSIPMVLIKQARSSGADRYSGKMPDGKRIDVYIPQSMSRHTGKASVTANVTLEVPE